MKWTRHEHCKDEQRRGRSIGVAAHLRLLPAAGRRLRKRTQMENANGFNATVIKAMYGGVQTEARSPAPLVSIWQNKAKNINDSNASVILAPSLPFRRQML